VGRSGKCQLGGLAPLVEIAQGVFTISRLDLSFDHCPAQAMGSLYAVVAIDEDLLATDLVLVDEDRISSIEGLHVKRDAVATKPGALGLDSRLVERGDLDHRHLTLGHVQRYPRRFRFEMAWLRMRPSLAYEGIGSGPWLRRATPWAVCTSTWGAVRGFVSRMAAHRPQCGIGLVPMTDLTARQRGITSILAFDLVNHPFNPQLVELFEDLNGRYFDGLLPVVPVCQGIPEGFDQREDPNGLLRLMMYPKPDAPLQASATLHLADELFEAPWGSEEARWEKITDTLLHQMVHFAVQVDALGAAHPLEEHHGEHFTEECNRIGQQAGWALVWASAEDVSPNEDATGWPDNAIERGSG